jgi:hypothetical protein
MQFYYRINMKPLLENLNSPFPDAVRVVNLNPLQYITFGAANS